MMKIVLKMPIDVKNIKMVRFCPPEDDCKVKAVMYGCMKQVARELKIRENSVSLCDLSDYLYDYLRM